MSNMEIKLAFEPGQIITAFPDKVEIKDGKVFVYSYSKGERKINEYPLSSCSDLVITDNIWSGR